MRMVLTVVLTIVLLASLGSAQAADDQKVPQPQQSMPMMNHQGMMDCPMMKSSDGKMMMNCPMMKGGGSGMMGGMKCGMMQHHQMMMHDMMQMMKDMMAIQKQLLGTPSADAKIKMEQDLSAMITKMDTMVSSSHSMMMDTQKPAAGDQEKKQPMPAEHKH